MCDAIFGVAYHSRGEASVGVEVCLAQVIVPNGPVIPLALKRCFRADISGVVPMNKKAFVLVLEQAKLSYGRTGRAWKSSQARTEHRPTSQ
jgi:hypothetical protein